MHSIYTFIIIIIINQYCFWRKKCGIPLNGHHVNWNSKNNIAKQYKIKDDEYDKYYHEPWSMTTTMK